MKSHQLHLFFKELKKRLYPVLCIFFIGWILCVQTAPAQSQDLYQRGFTLQVNNTTIEQALLQIENSTAYRFIYDSELENLQKKVTINIKAANIGELLTELLKNSGLTYILKENNLIIITKIPAAVKTNVEDNDKVVSGIVTGENGSPLAGVSVQVKGKNKGTATNSNGEYSINVAENDVLVFSYVGYASKEISVAGKTTLNVSLISKKEELTQIVIVGYGTQRKIDITGATGSVKGAEIVKQPVMTATQAIQGKVAGVQIITSGQPGTQPSVRIRGTGSILGGAEPLYVVDGVITTDITNINTADITNIDILKDASSTAIYGARGANGVIIITTKQGTTGKMQINYSGYVGINTAAHMVKMANADEYANYITQASYGLRPLTPTSFSTNWYNEILRTAVESNNSISISGASDKTKYYLNLGYTDDEGIVITNEYRRFTIRSNDEFTLAKNLKLGLISSYQNGNNQIPNLATAYTDAYRAAPVIQSEVNGKYGNTSLYQNVGNPILDINQLNSRTIDNRLEGNTFLEYKPIPSLTFKSQIGGDWDNNVNTAYNYAFAADTNTFIIAGGNQSNLYSSLGINSANSLHWVWDNTVTYNQRFNKQNLTVLAGTTAEKQTSSWIYARGQGVPPNSNLWYLNNSNFALPFSINGGTYPGTPSVRNSYLARVNYSYDNKYLFTGTFRADGSSNFPANNRWGYFPSFGAGWVISRENFMQRQHIFDMLKLRASWGLAGNDFTNSGTNGYTSTLLTGLPYYFAGSAVSGSIPSQIIDKDLKWETTTESDVAIEFTALKSRLSGEFSLYSKITSNSLINVLVPSTLGSYNPNGAAGYVLTNAASVRNKGVELQLGWNDNIGKDFSYSISGNITFNNNDVVGLNGGQAFIDGPIGADQPFVTRTDVGHPIGSFYVQKVLGINQNGSSNPGTFNYHLGANGQPDSTYAGSYQPKFYYGTNIVLRYKKFDLSIAGYGTAGGKIYSGIRAFRQSSQDNLEASIANSFWTPSNHSNTQPSANVLSGELPASTYFVENGSYFRINNLNIGYTIPPVNLAKTKIISSLRIYISVQNLVTFTKYSGFSPDIEALLPITSSNSGMPVTSSATNAGIDLNAYPAVRTYSLGINAGF